MNDEEKEEAIAKYCGWESLRGDSDYRPCYRWRTSGGEVLENPLHSLDAIQRAVEHLTDAQKRQFALWLIRIISRKGHETGWKHEFECLNAGPKDRAAAFLYAIGIPAV